MPDNELRTALSDIVGHDLRSHSMGGSRHYNRYEGWGRTFYCTCSFRANVDARIPFGTVQAWHDDAVTDEAVRFEASLEYLDVAWWDEMTAWFDALAEITGV